MIETFFLFIALLILEVILEIDNVTALRKAAEGLPDTPLCRGQMPHILALGVRVGLAYCLFHAVSTFTHTSTSSGHNFLEQLGGVVIILVACTLIINYHQGGKAARNKLANRMKTKKTNLVSFLIADAFLSMDTVIAAVAMTTNFKLALAAMVAASVCIMLFHRPLHAWLELNPRMALIAFAVIGLLGVNLIFAADGIAIPKVALLLVVFI
jgi:predicted tellurium resistance membrane protein TerC